MKKIFNILAAGLMSVFALISCAEKEIVTYVPDNVVAPVLDELSTPEGGFVLVEGENFAALTFSPVDFGIATAARYTAYVDVNEDFSTKQSLGNVTTDTLGITISASTLNNALMAMLCDPEVPVTVYFMLQTEMMGESSPVEAVGIISSNVISTTVVPYNAERTYDMIYVPGAKGAWDFTSTFLFCYEEDDDTYEGVVDMGESYETVAFKITTAADWADQYTHGSDGTVTDADPASMTLVNPGSDITNYRSARYYNFTFVKSTKVLSMNVSFNQVGIIGLNGDWNNDIVMTQNPANGQFYADIEVTSATEFKFRLDAAWGNDWGGSIDELVKGGTNIAIEPGNYRVYLDLNVWDAPTASLSTADYGQPVE